MTFQCVFAGLPDISAESVVAGLYDGNVAALKSIIEASDADDLARDHAFVNLVTLVHQGRIGRHETEAYLASLYDTLQPRDHEYVWWSWTISIAHLGMTSLVPLVREAYARGYVDESCSEPANFDVELQDALDRKGPPPEIIAEPIEDAVDLLERWWNGEGVEDLAWDDKHAKYWPTPHINPLRHVGRNDPCPCGSGKKFKKCCLDKDR